MQMNFKWLVFLCFLYYSFFPAYAQDFLLADPDPNRFKKEIENFIHWDKKNSFPSNSILFIGSSSIKMWSTAECFPGLPVINRGFGGAHISDINYFYDTIVKKYKPMVIVFYAGDNDIAAEKGVSRVFEDFSEFTSRLEKDMPDTPLLYLTIKPSIARWEYWDEMNEVNMRIKECYAENKFLIFVDTASLMLGEDGSPKKDLFLDDGLHLNEAGYSLWMSVVKSHLQKAIKRTF
jgi:lysophospholipase L1-like esterase